MLRKASSQNTGKLVVMDFLISVCPHNMHLTITPHLGGSIELYTVRNAHEHLLLVGTLSQGYSRLSKNH